MNKLKSIPRAWVLMNGVFFLLLMVTRPVFAADSIDIDSLISSLPAGWAGGVTAVFIVLYAIAQLRAVLPPSVTDKIPSVVMMVLDFVAANYKHARNASVAKQVTDTAKAAGATDDEYRVAVETAKNRGELRGSRIESAGDYPGNDHPGSKDAQ